MLMFKYELYNETIYFNSLNMIMFKYEFYYETLYLKTSTCYF